MSLTIENLKFTIFGSGHDYTLADSGDGETRIFSHPFVPLNSVNYAGQYMFYVPDENGEPMDCVLDDIAHCTFTPALGTAFTTEGEVTVEVNYHREYVYPEDTLIVDKTVSQTVTVVNHGSVSQSGTYCDLYSDGYQFFRPYNVNTADDNIELVGQGAYPTKVSCIPYRVTKLGTGDMSGFSGGFDLADISELKYADTSRVTHICRLFANGSDNLTLAQLTEALGEWELPNLEYLELAFIYSLRNPSVTNLSFLSKWVTPKLKSLNGAFNGMNTITSLNGIEHLGEGGQLVDFTDTWRGCSSLTDISAISGYDVSSVTSMSFSFSSDSSLTDISPLANWNPVSLNNISGIFNQSAITTLDALIGWTSPITTISQAFASCPITSVAGLANLDVSRVTVFNYTFQHDNRLTTLDGLEGWNVSNGTQFIEMFYDDSWLSDISAIAGWVFSSATDVHNMFYSAISILNLDDVTAWRFDSSINMGHMFYSSVAKCYSTYLGIPLVSNAYYYFDYDGRQYTYAEVANDDNPLTYPSYDATGATDWTTGTSKDAFDNYWSNVPAWN